MDIQLISQDVNLGSSTPQSQCFVLNYTNKYII